MTKLGRWAVIDIETSGIDPTYDQIIDIGFLQFDGIKLTRKYSSLVKADVVLSQFIQKLTGIKQEQVKKAPAWQKIEPDLLELEGHALIAHNASFEEMFLKKYFEDLGQDRIEESFQDSMYFLSLIFPERSSLNLESILIDLKIAEKEEHRGLSDSIDLLRVLLVATMLAKKDIEFEAFLIETFKNFSGDEFWFKNFIHLELHELHEIDDQIDFDLEQAFETYKNSLGEDDFDGSKYKRKKLDFTGPNIKEILRDEKDLKEKLTHYTFRESQEKLSLRIGQAFTNNIHALIQAPTGTGKTLGYLLPSILLSKSKGEQVMVSTGTKALQNQAMSKDIPLAFKMLGLGKFDLNVIRLIGSKNHYCELLYRNEQRENDSMLDMREFGERFTEAYFETLFFYNQRVSDYSKIITRDSIPYVMKRKFKQFADKDKSIQVDYRSCTGHKCPFKNECTYVQGLRLSLIHI